MKNMKKIKDEIELMEKCPRFDYCSAPKCPLDPFMNERVYYKPREAIKRWGEIEPVCNSHLGMRRKIAKGHNLPLMGLTREELNKLKSGSKRIAEYFTDSELKKLKNVRIEKEDKLGRYLIVVSDIKK
jgi:hypothetical protein